MSKLENQVNEFIDRRLEEELWEQRAEDTKYNNEIDNLINLVEKQFGRESNECSLIHKLSDLYCSQISIMQNKAYKVGFNDGLKFENTLNNI